MPAESKADSLNTKDVDINYSYLDQIYDGVRERSISRWTVLLPGSGCEWARKEHKGCSFCAFNARIDQITGGKLFSHEEMMGVFEMAKAKVAGSAPVLLAMFNGGNYINDKEIVAAAQLDLLRYAANHTTIETALFETKTEYLSKRKIDACLKAIGSKRLRIAIGLECKDDRLRNEVINKGMSKQAYERAIKYLHTLGIEVQSYVFMKPLTVTESEAIREAIDTIEYAVDCGSDIVMLEAAMVQKGTAFEDAFNKKEFDSPWLWSIKEVVEKTRHLKQLNVGIFDEEPKPLSYPKNCDRCTLDFNMAFRNFRETHDFGPLSRMDCVCKADWSKVIGRS